MGQSRYGLFIGGESRPSQGGRTFPSENPYTGEAWTQIAAADPLDVEAAVAAAVAAGSRREAWRRDGQLRARALLSLADLLEENADAIATTESVENGKAIRETAVQARFAARNYRFFAGLADKVDGRVVSVDAGDSFDFVLREPLGVCALLLAWNSPMQLLANKLAPALAAGNTVVVKPSELASASVLEFAALTARAGFPPGVVNVVTGDGAVGAALVGHPAVEMVSLTGGRKTARAVGAIAAEAPKKVVLELGGKSPNIVFDDADLDRAAGGVVAGVFGAAGQSCTAGSRLLVQASVREALLERIVELARAIVLGDPLDPATEVGPLVSEALRNSVQERLGEALEAGGEVLTGGSPPADLGRGWFFEPTVVTGVRPDAWLAREEVFGPVLAVLEFEADEEAVAIANDSEFGLAAGVWTRDVQRAMRTARDLEAGSIWLNTYRKVSPAAPFGGYKRSGFGRERGIEAMLEYTQTKNVMLDVSGAARQSLSIQA